MSILILIAIFMGTNVIDFRQDGQLSSWYVVNDGVMGGLSKGNIEHTKEGIQFSGKLSLENNGGFSWAHFDLEGDIVINEDPIIIMVKTDDHAYHFTAISSDDVRFHFESKPFSTHGEWQEIRISPSDMQKTWRGRKFSEFLSPENDVIEFGIILKDKKPGKFDMSLASIQY